MYNKKRLVKSMQKTLKQIIDYKNHRVKIMTVALLALLFSLILFSLSQGKAEIDVGQIIRVVLGKISGNNSFFQELTEAQTAIIWDIRFPRILIAVLVGSGLAVSGAVFQSLLMNPLADSYTMGVSSGAAFGASLAIYINIFLPYYFVPVTLAAFVGAFLTLGLVVLVARAQGNLSTSNLVIAGIIVSTILSAAISMIKSIAGEEVSAIIGWLMGSLVARGWEDVTLGFPVILACIGICIYYAGDLNIMCLGEQEARSLGVDTQRLRRILLVCGSLITAVCVSVSGIIGFVGLIVPHLLRFMVGSDNRVLLPLSALFGGGLLLLADTGARVLLNVEVPVGVVTTLLGGPFFIYIFINRKKSFAREG